MMIKNILSKVKIVAQAFATVIVLITTIVLPLRYINMQLRIISMQPLNLGHLAALAGAVTPLFIFLILYPPAGFQQRIKPGWVTTALCLSIPYWFTALQLIISNQPPTPDVFLALLCISIGVYALAILTRRKVA